MAMLISAKFARVLLNWLYGEGTCNFDCHSCLDRSMYLPQLTKCMAVPNPRAPQIFLLKPYIKGPASLKKPLVGTYVIIIIIIQS